MELMTMAGHLSLVFSATVEGPFAGPADGDQTVLLWLPNRRGVSMLRRAATGETESIVIRETVPDRDVTYEATPWRTDYSTPVPNGGEVRPATLERVRDMLTILRDLGTVDPRDQRSTLPGAREWRAVHYGESRPACGAMIRDDDACTTVVGDVRCTDCLEVINRSV